MQSICQDTQCIITTVERAKAKRERLEHFSMSQEQRLIKRKLEKLQSKPELTKKAQAAFNAYIRARDYGKPCICCGKPIAWGEAKTGGVCDAGHYLSRGAHVQHSFNEDNVHAQLKYCNKSLSGNFANYRKGLIARIGIERVEALENSHDLNHYTKDELREIAATYKAKLKTLTKE